MLLETENMKKLAVFAWLLFTACAENPSLLSPPGTDAAEVVAEEGLRHRENPREVFRTAVRLFDEGDRKAAEPLFLSSLQGLPSLGDYSLRHLARIAEARGDPQTAIDHWRSIADRFPASPWRGEAALALARERSAAGDLGGAEHWLTEARREALSAEEQAAILWFSSQLAFARGDEATARSLAADLRTRFPASAEAHEARDRAWAERERVALDRLETAHSEAALLLVEGQANRALELVQMAERRWPRHPDFPALRLLEASALRKRGDPEEAVRVLEDLRKGSPRHWATVEAIHRLATIVWNRDDDQRALDLFDLYVRRHPRGELAAESLYATGRIHQEANRYAAAARAFARLVRNYPPSRLAAESAWRVGWCEYRAGRMRNAATHFAKAAGRPDGDRPAALYWKARSFEKTRGPAREAYEALLREFPESYYAMLAELRTHHPEGSAISGRARPATGSESGMPSGGGNEELARFDELRGMGLKSLARIELAAQARRSSIADPLSLARAWAEIDAHREAIQILSRQHACGIEVPSVSLCYPLAFWPLVEHETARRGLDPFLVLSVIRQESLFDTEATSPADARGLMQLLPATAARLAREAGQTDFRPEFLFDADENVRFGTTYLADLLTRYQGNTARALAAYNAGEAAVDKWQARYGDLEDDEFVESISYRETRSYVKRVLQHWRIYRALYPGALTQSAERVSGGRDTGN